MQAAYFCLSRILINKVLREAGLPARLNYLCLQGNENQNKVSFTPRNHALFG
jgi:hypothetical protein